MKKILAVIPARGGSKRIPNKNLRLLNGKPLICHIIETAKKVAEIDKILISTDSDEIARLAGSNGVGLAMRPPHLANDDATLSDVIKDVYRSFNKYDCVLSIQPTCPFTTKETIQKVIDVWRDTRCHSVATMTKLLQGHPYITKRVDGNGRVTPFIKAPKGLVIDSSHKREVCYFLTGAVYLRDKRLLKSKDRSPHFLGKHCQAVIVDEREAVDINYESDFKYAEFLMKST